MYHIFLSGNKFISLQNVMDSNLSMILFLEIIQMHVLQNTRLKMVLTVLYS